MLPGLVPGDILLVSKRRKARKGDIVVARQNGREVVKRVKKITKKGYDLIGDNKKESIDSRRYGPAAEKDILGVAVWAIGLPRFFELFRPIRRHRIVFVLVGAIGIFSIFAFMQRGHVFSEQSLRQTPQIKEIVQPIKPKYTVGAVSTDVPYCNGQALDIYYPRKAVYETAPVVMYFHGGGWQINNKSSEPNQLAVIDPLRDEGFAVVSIDYRKLPDNFFPTPVNDALCSVRYLRATKATNGLDAEKIGIYGFSAGGHLAAMVGVLDNANQFNEGPYKEQSSRVKAVVTLAGILNFEQGTRYNNDLKIRYFLNGAEKGPAHPMTYITPDDPPFLLVHGADDQYVDPAQDQLFGTALAAAGVQNDSILVQNADHGLGATNGPPLPSNDEVNQRIRGFLKQNLLK